MIFNEKLKWEIIKKLKVRKEENKLILKNKDLKEKDLKKKRFKKEKLEIIY